MGITLLNHKKLEPEQLAQKLIDQGQAEKYLTSAVNLCSDPLTRRLVNMETVYILIRQGYRADEQEIREGVEPSKRNLSIPPNTSTTEATTEEKEFTPLTAGQKSENAKKLMFMLWNVRSLKLQICNDYDSYFQFVSACAKSTGEFGRKYCREICERSLKYDAKAFEKLYDQQINNPKNTFGFGTVKMMVDNQVYKDYKVYKAYKQLFPEQWDFDNLPSQIPQGKNKNEKICYLMGFITTMSAVMPHTYFWYDSAKYYLNLYTIIQGKLASGKSKATKMTHCIDEMDKYVRDNVEPEVKHCIHESENISDAMLIWDLNHNQENLNEGSTLISTAELDVMGAGKKWGLSSENTRLAWDHETIRCKRKGVDAQSRKEDRAGYMIKEPKISMLLCGTENQLPHYFQNNSDGNLSRFLIYTLDENFEYRSGVGIEDPNRTTQHNRLFTMWLNQMQQLKENNYRTKLVYTESQKAQLDEIFASLKHFFASQRDDFHNYINRMPIAVMRIAGVLSTLRFWDEGRLTPEELSPTDQECTLAIQLVLNSLDSLYRTYSHPLISHRETVKRQVWVDMLTRVPHKFETPTFLNVAIEEGYSENSARCAITYLQQNGYIKKLRQGHYEQISCL